MDEVKIFTPPLEMFHLKEAPENADRKSSMFFEENNGAGLIPGSNSFTKDDRSAKTGNARIDAFE